MARVLFLSNISREDYFRSLKKLSGASWQVLAKKLNVSNRHFTDYRKGISTFPESISKVIEKQFVLKLPKDILIKKDYWYIKGAAKMGGKRRFELYGALGTRESRKKGGFNSLKSHLAKNTGFVTAKKILLPNKTIKLAEIVGVLMGDGSMTARQVHIYLDLKTDQEYAKYLHKLTEELFGLKVGISRRENESTLVLRLNSVRLLSFLKRIGLPNGNKIKQGLNIPLWINTRISWQIACLRGLFDTDGCTYVDFHKYKNKVYRHICVAFTTYSPDLLQSMHVILRRLGYSPTLSGKRNILLRKENEVLRFFQEFKPSNKKHFDKIKKFMEEYRSGYNGIASKAIVAVRRP